MRLGFFLALLGISGVLFGSLVLQIGMLLAIFLLGFLRLLFVVGRMIVFVLVMAFLCGLVRILVRSIIQLVVCLLCIR